MFGTDVHDKLAPFDVADTVSTGAAVGPVAHPLFVGVGAAHPIPCRVNALAIAVMCGVPLLVFPSSSSLAINCI